MNGVMYVIINKVIIPLYKTHPLILLFLGFIAVIGYLIYKKPYWFNCKSFNSIALIILTVYVGFALGVLAFEKPRQESYISSDVCTQQSNSGNVTFTGGQDDNGNYEYYMEAARKHKENADYYYNESRKAFDWASSYANSNPERSQSFSNEGRSYSQKGDSEMSSYKDDLSKAESYR